MSTQFQLLAPGGSPADVLVPIFERAHRAGGRVEYLVPSGRLARLRLRQLARRAPLLDAHVEAIDGLASRLLRRAGNPPAQRPDRRVVDLLLREAIARTWPAVVSGPGLERAARRTIAQLSSDGWTPDEFEAALERADEPYAGTRRLLALWRAFHVFCPEADAAAPLREALERGLVRADPPELLLIEGGPLQGQLHARLIADLVDAVRDAGGDIIAVSPDVPTPDGPHGRALAFLRHVLGVEPEPAGGTGDRPRAAAGDAGRAPAIARGGDPAPTVSHGFGRAPTIARVVRHLFRAGGGSVEGAGSADRDRSADGAGSVEHGRSAARGRDLADRDAVIRLTAPTDRGTADVVAREILTLLRAAASPETVLERGIVVACPTAADRATAEAALRRHGVPVARLPREPAAEHPGGRYVLTLLDALDRGGELPLDAALELIGTDGWALDPPVADQLARALRTGGAVTLADAIRMLRDADDEAAVPTRRRLERLLTAHDDFRRRSGSAERSVLLRGLLRKEWASGPDRWIGDPRRGPWRRYGSTALLDGHRFTPAVRGAAGYARPLRRLDDMLAALDERERRTGRIASAEEWLRDLRAMMERTQLRIGSEPALGVRVEPAGASEPADHVFILGLIERRFPRAPREAPFLPDALRALLARDADLLPPGLAAHGPDRERERFLLTIGAARRRVYLCHPRTDGDGKEVLPSFFLEDVAGAVGLESVDALPERRRRLREVLPAPGECVSEAELRASLAAALRDPELDEARRIEVRRAVDEMVARDGSFRRLLLAPFSDARAAIDDPEHRRWLADRSERLSASQLETYGHCAFRHFAERRLDPRSIELPVFDALRRGGVVHELLWRFGAEWRGWDDLEAGLARIDAAAPAGLEPSVLTANRSRNEWAHWRTRLRGFLEAEHARVAAADFRPEYHELAFGEPREPRDPRSRPEPAELAFGDHRIRFSGSIDRVDTWTDDDGTVRGVAVDYKTGDVRRYRKELERGDELQLLLYLRMLEDFGIRPAAALYVSVKDEVVAGVVRAEFADRIGPYGRHVLEAGDDAWAELRRRADARIVEHYERMRRPVIAARPKDWDCRWCELQGLCRIDLWRARQNA